MHRLALALVLALVACRPPEGPEATLRAYLAALGAGRLDDAYALMSSQYKKSHDKAAFERAVGSSESRALLAQLRKAPAKVALTAELPLPDGDRLPLVWERNAWRLGRDPLDFYPQGAPLEALRSFVRAVENRRYDVVWRFVPNRYRATITVEKLRERWEGERRAELLGQLEAVRAHLGDPFDVSADEARLPVGERKQARLVREDGAWKIETLE